MRARRNSILRPDVGAEILFDYSDYNHVVIESKHINIFLDAIPLALGVFQIY